MIYFIGVYLYMVHITLLYYVVLSFGYKIISKVFVDQFCMFATRIIINIISLLMCETDSSTELCIFKCFVIIAKYLI